MSYLLERLKQKQGMKKKKAISVTKLKGKAQKIFNAYIRSRDSQDGYFICISCGRTLPVDKMNAGHYVPVKGGSMFIMDEWNVNGECEGCNCFDEFHLIGYRRNLINKIGEDAVKYLEDNRRKEKKWTRTELEQIIITYGSVKRKAA
jgi:5-methylcytosine-specific restriction endonuclease McrA